MIIRPEGSDVGVWVDDPPLSTEELAAREELDRQRAVAIAARAAREETNEAARMAKLKKRLTKRVLEVFVEAARTYGWNGDYIEVVYFINWCFDVARKDRPSSFFAYGDDDDERDINLFTPMRGPFNTLAEAEMVASRLRKDGAEIVRIVGTLLPGESSRRAPWYIETTHLQLLEPR